MGLRQNGTDAVRVSAGGLIMSLKVSAYDPEANAIAFSTGKPHDAADSLDNHPLTVIDYVEDTHEPTSLDVIGFSYYIPLSPYRGYCKETDTLTFGEEAETATLIVEGDDLVAYWRCDGPDPDDYVAVAVELRNASKHLAPVIANLPR